MQRESCFLDRATRALIALQHADERPLNSGIGQVPQHLTQIPLVQPLTPGFGKGEEIVQYSAVRRRVEENVHALQEMLLTTARHPAVVTQTPALRKGIEGLSGRESLHRV